MPPLALALLAALSILLITVGLSSLADARTQSRLRRYAAEGAAGRTSAVDGMALRNAALERLERVVAGRDFGARIARDLSRADIDLTVSEFLALRAVAAIGIPVAMLVASPAIPTFGSPAFVLLGALLGVLLPATLVSRRRSTRQRAFADALPDTVTLIANALRSGSSFLQSIELVVRESQPVVSSEFARLVREVNLGLPLEKALDNMVSRIDSPDFELMSIAVAIQYQVGGNLAEILDSIALTIRERVRIKGEIRTLTAQQRLSGYVVALLPIVLILFLSIASPGFLAPMFVKPPEVLGLPAGVVLLFMGGSMMLFGFLAIRRIVDIEV